MEEQDEKTRRAAERVQAMTAFYAHLAVFVVVIAILLIVNMTVSSVWWVQWVLLGWGAGLIGHYLLVFGEFPDFVRRWQERKIEELKNKG
jgi:hypothetical protein